MDLISSQRALLCFVIFLSLSSLILFLFHNDNHYDEIWARRILSAGAYIPEIQGEYTDYSELVKNVIGTTHRESEKNIIKRLQAKNSDFGDIATNSSRLKEALESVIASAGPWNPANRTFENNDALHGLVHGM